VWWCRGGGAAQVGEGDFESGAVGTGRGGATDLNPATWRRRACTAFAWGFASFSFSLPRKGEDVWGQVGCSRETVSNLGALRT
jgi:hypothetical protein